MRDLIHKRNHIISTSHKSKIIYGFLIALILTACSQGGNIDENMPFSRVRSKVEKMSIPELKEATKNVKTVIGGVPSVVKTLR